MPNRAQRARHLTLVPDAPTDPGVASWDHYVGDEPASASPSAIARPAIRRLLLHVEVEGIRPRVWRQIRVRSDFLLPELHVVVRSVLGWPDRDDYMFAVDSGGKSRTYYPQQGPRSDTIDGGRQADHVRFL